MLPDCSRVSSRHAPRAVRSGPAMTKTHHYARNGRQYGPVSVPELQALLQNGRLAPTDLVWAEGMPEWKPAAEIPELVPPNSPKAAAPRDHAPPRGQPATAEQNPAPSPGAVPVAGDSASPPARKVAEVARQFLRHARQTATATGQHLAVLFACGMTQGKIGLARREALRLRAALGEKMYGAGLGEADNRRLVDDLTGRIRNLKSAGSSARPLEKELRAAHAALAEPALQQDQAPPGLTTEFQAACTARNDLQAAQAAEADARANLQSLHARQALRIGTGYLCAILVLSGILWAARGTGIAERPAPGPGP